MHFFFLCFCHSNRTVKQPIWIIKTKATEQKVKQKINSDTYLLQLIITSSGITRHFSMPCFGWSPRPRNRPGGSILKLPIFCLWPSIMQKPYSFCTFSLAALIAWQQHPQTHKLVFTKTHVRPSAAVSHECFDYQFSWLKNQLLKNKKTHTCPALANNIIFSFKKA